jgi:hypothetical protein
MRIRTREGLFLVAASTSTALFVLACATGTDSVVSAEGGPEPADGARDVFVIPADSGTQDTGGPPPDDAASCTAQVVINELKTDGTTANDELIELFNPGSCAVPLGDWQLKYQSSSGGAGLAGYKFEIGASILAGGYLVLTPGSSSTPLTPGMAGASGQVGLLDDKGTLVDAVAYGSVTAGSYREGQSAPSPPTNGSIGRSPSGTDTGNNKSDFKTYTTPSPNVANP